MPAPTLAIQDVKTVFKRYDELGKPRPGLLKILDEVGQLKGVDGKVGSIPRLKKLIDEINLEELNQRFDLKKPLPDPITALASQLYNQLYEDVEQYEARIRNEYTVEIAALTQLIATLHETIEHHQQAFAEQQQVLHNTETQLAETLQISKHQQQQLTATHATIAQQNSLLEKANETVVATKSLLIARESDFALQLAHANEKINTLDNTVQQIKSEHTSAIKNKEHHIDDLKNDIIGRQSYINQLNEKIQHSEKSHDKLTALLAQKTTELNDQQQRITELQSEKQTIQENLLQLQPQLTHKADEILRLNKELFAKEKNILTLQAELGTLRKDIAALKKKVKP